MKKHIPFIICLISTVCFFSLSSGESDIEKVQKVAIENKNMVEKLKNEFKNNSSMLKKFEKERDAFEKKVMTRSYIYTPSNIINYSAYLIGALTLAFLFLNLFLSAFLYIERKKILEDVKSKNELSTAWWDSFEMKLEIYDDKVKNFVNEGRQSFEESLSKILIEHRRISDEGIDKLQEFDSKAKKLEEEYENKIKSVSTRMKKLEKGRRLVIARFFNGFFEEIMNTGSFKFPDETIVKIKKIINSFVEDWVSICDLFTEDQIAIRKGIAKILKSSRNHSYLSIRLEEIRNEFRYDERMVDLVSKAIAEIEEV